MFSVTLQSLSLASPPRPLLPVALELSAWPSEPQLSSTPSVELSAFSEVRNALLLARLMSELSVPLGVLLLARVLVELLSRVKTFEESGGFVRGILVGLIFAVTDVSGQKMTSSCGA